MSLNIRKVCLNYLLIGSLLLFWLPARSQPDLKALDQLFAQNKKALGNDFAALVWKDGKVIYQKQNPDFTAKTQTPILNSGNWLTAALVMTFVDAGKISLDDKVSKYIPMFSTYMKNYITLRHCLSNTTGIQSEAGVLKVFQKSKFPTLEDEVNAFASKREIQSNPGTEFYYSNIGPDIVARVLEIITKKSFDRLIQDRILRPLRMRATNFTNDEGGAVSPSGGAKSTANDYMNFMIMLLNKGVFEGKTILSAKSVEEIETAQFASLPVKYIPKNALGQHYALGSWVMESGNDGKATVIGCANLVGVLPYIDLCRKYAAIVIAPKPEEEIKGEFYLHFKEIVDGQMQASCQ